MSKIISISIPEDLYKKLQKVKDRLNVSQLCKNAINEAVVFEEARESININVMKARLKKERLEFAKKYLEKGMIDGVKDAKKLSYENLLYIDADDKDDLSVQGIHIEDLFYDFASEETKENIKNLINFTGDPEESDAEKEEYRDVQAWEYGFEYFEDVYYGGWVKGVKRVFNRIKDDLKINTISDL